MRNRVLFILISIVCISFADGQPFSGRIEYDRTVYWTKILDELSYLSQEERDRTKFTWGKEDGYTTQMELLWNGQKSVYQMSGDQKEKNSQWSWRNEELYFFEDRELGTCQDIVELPDRVYRVEDHIPAYHWKILSDIKEVQGYLCMSAETYDSVRNHRIVAWFSTEIPVPIGPERYGGLPGAILELDIQNGSCLIAARAIRTDTLIPVNQPVRSKKQKVINNKKLSALQASYIKQCIAYRRNPYWNLRY